MNDAEKYRPELAKGSTEIWYYNAGEGRDFSMGAKSLKKYMPEKIPSKVEDLSNTHTLIGSIKETDPDKIYYAMQGEMWSPKGEARNLEPIKKVKHTSMSVGDIIVVGGKMLMVDRDGFETLN